MSRARVVAAVAIAILIVVAGAAGGRAGRAPHGIVEFTKTNAGAWTFEWHIVLAPDDTKNNEFRIVSRLQTAIPAGAANAARSDGRLLSAVLVDKREIQEHPGEPVNIKFRLADDPRIHTYPQGYQYLSVPIGFSRIGGFRNGTIPDPVRPYGMSNAMYMLGSKIVGRSFATTGDFAGARIHIATVRTTDGPRAYTYEIFLERYPLRP